MYSTRVSTLLSIFNCKDFIDINNVRKYRLFRFIGYYYPFP